jgi:hypothetical protein
MFAVKGIYTSAKTVELESPAPVNEDYEVIVTFVSPTQRTATSHTLQNQNDLAESQAAYQSLLKFKGTLNRHIDYKKELAEYRDERYGNSR